MQLWQLLIEMNIYIDTNILYADPFFRSNFSELMIKSATEKNIHIIIPEICLNEILFKLSDRAITLDYEIQKRIREINSLTEVRIVELTFDPAAFRDRSEKFYREKIDSKVLNLLTIKPAHFTENLAKSINKSLPFFSEKKEEFRDALIWSSVRDDATESNESKNYFLTANYNDFWNHDKSDFHPNLKKESSSLIILESVKRLFEIETSLIDFKRKEEFKKWLEDQGLTIDSIQNAINSYLWTHISDFIDAGIKQYPIKKISLEHELGFIVPEIIKDDFEIVSIESVIPVEDFATLEINSRLRFEGNLHLPNYEKGDFSNSEAKAFYALIKLNITYDKDLLFKPIGADILDIEIV